MEKLSSEMKAKRTITVNDHRYHWTVSLKLYPKKQDHVHVAIWFAEMRGQKLNLQLRYDDPWLNFGAIIICRESKRLRSGFELRPVTPAEIHKLILTALENGWTPEKKAPQLHFYVNRNTQQLYPVSQIEYHAG